MFSYLRKHISILKKEIQDVSHNISFTTFLYIFIYKRVVSYISYKIMNSGKLFHAKKINSIYIKVLGD